MWHVQDMRNVYRISVLLGLGIGGGTLLEVILSKSYRMEGLDLLGLGQRPEGRSCEYVNKILHSIM